MNLGAAALIPIVVVAIGFEVFCLVDLARTDEVSYLPRWAWAVVCLITIPLGGVAYLVFGKTR
jgi:Phospholipase_D-nuclease N-terminal